MNRTRSLAVTAVLTLTSAASQAQVASTNPRYTCIETVVDVLADAHDAFASINGQSSDDLFHRMTASKNARLEIDQASRRLAPYLQSTDENQKAGAEGLTNALDLVRQAIGIQISLYEKLDNREYMNGTRSAVSDIAVKITQSRKLMLAAAPMIVASVVVPDPTDPQNHIALAITPAEQRTLIKTLKTRFDGKLPTTNGDTPPASAAKIMLKGLDQDWRYATGK